MQLEDIGPDERRLVESFAVVARQVRTTDDPQQAMQQITEAALMMIPACDSASITLLTGNDCSTAAATDELALAGDLIQYEEREGPCLDAAGGRQEWVVTPDVQSPDVRWPRSSARIGELGVGSMLSLRLSLDSSREDTLGGLNLYSRSVNAFGEDELSQALLLTSLASVVIDGSRKQAHLRQAISSRQVIGEAIGILRAQSNLTRDEAFALLVRASQRSNVKLRDVAASIAQSPDGQSAQAQSPDPQAAGAQAPEARSAEAQAPKAGAEPGSASVSLAAGDADH